MENVVLTVAMLIDTACRPKHRDHPFRRAGGGEENPIVHLQRRIWSFKIEGDDEKLKGSSNQQLYI